MYVLSERLPDQPWLPLFVGLPWNIAIKDTRAQSLRVKDLSHFKAVKLKEKTGLFGHSRECKDAAAYIWRQVVWQIGDVGVHCVNLFLPWLIRNDCSTRRDLSGNETYMALPLMPAGDLWPGSMPLTIQQIYNFAKHSLFLSNLQFDLINIKNKSKGSVKSCFFSLIVIAALYLPLVSGLFAAALVSQSVSDRC